MPTLWRNGVLLGELEVQPHRNPDQISGVFKPTSAMVERETIWQFRARPPLSPLAQIHMPPEVLGERGPANGPKSARSVVEIREGDRIPEVTPAERLEVRSADGSPVETDLMLFCWIIPDDEAMRAEIERMHGTLGNGRHLWSFVLTERA